MSGRLSPRQRQVTELVVQGLNIKEIARALGIGYGTVKIHLTAARHKVGARSVTDLAVWFVCNEKVTAGDLSLRMTRTDSGSRSYYFSQSPLRACSIM